MRFPDRTDALKSCYRGGGGADKRAAAARAVLALACVCAVVSSAAGQPLPVVEVDVVSPRVYAQAVDAYVAGSHDEGVARLARVVPRAVLDAARETLPALAAEAGTLPAGVTPSRTPDDAVRRWRGAVVLHLDTAHRLARRYSAEAVAPHLAAVDVALGRLADADRRPDAATFRARCQVARLHHLTVAGEPQAFDQLATGLTGVADVDLLFARGVSHETRARALPPRPQRRPTRAMAPLASATLAGARRVWYQSHLRYAADAYRRVLTHEPTHADATLRLARVLLEQGEAEAALAQLQPLTSSASCAGSACGLAWLTRGEALEQHGAFDGAREAYARAAADAEVYPTALVALHALADGSAAELPPHPAPEREPDADGSGRGRDLTSAMRGRTERHAPTPWRDYLIGVTPTHRQLMTTLRESLR